MSLDNSTTTSSAYNQLYKSRNNSLGTIEKTRLQY